MSNSDSDIDADAENRRLIRGGGATPPPPPAGAPTSTARAPPARQTRERWCLVGTAVAVFLFVSAAMRVLRPTGGAATGSEAAAFVPKPSTAVDVRTDLAAATAAVSSAREHLGDLSDTLDRAIATRPAPTAATTAAPTEGTGAAWWRDDGEAAPVAASAAPTAKPPAPPPSASPTSAAPTRRPTDMFPSPTSAAPTGTAAAPTFAPSAPPTPATADAAATSTTTVVSAAECPAPFDARCCRSDGGFADAKRAYDRGGAQRAARGAKHVRAPSQAQLNAEYSTLSLDETFAYLRDGGSLSRFGDGELKLLRGKKGGWEDPHSDGGAMARAGLAFAASLGGKPGLRVCVGT